MQQHQMPAPGGGIEFGGGALSRRGGQSELTAPESLDKEDWRVRHLRNTGRPVTQRDLAIKQENGNVLLPPDEVLEEIRQQAANSRRRPEPVAVPSPAPLAFEDDDFDDDPPVAARDGGLDDLDDLIPPRRPRSGHRDSPVRFARQDAGDTVYATVPTMETLAAFEARIDAKLAAHARKVDRLIAESEKRTIKRVRKVIAQLVEADA